MKRSFAAAACTLVWGALLLLSGCDSSPGGDYETITSADADRIDQAREDRAVRDSSQDDGDVAERSSAKLSPVVLAAVRSAAAASRLPQATAPPSAKTSLDASSPSTALVQRPTSGPELVVEGDVLAKIAGSRAARIVGGEPLVRPIKLLVPERSFNVEGPGDALRISYDDFDLLKVLNMEPVPTNAVDHFPQWLSQLDGKRVRLRGFMFPTFQETDIPAFVLARDNQICCFGRNPKIYDLVDVTLANGETTDYIEGRPFDVVGNFHIHPEADGEELWQLYQLDNAVVVDE